MVWLPDLVVLARPVVLARFAVPADLLVLADFVVLARLVVPADLVVLAAFVDLAGFPVLAVRLVLADLVLVRAVRGLRAGAASSATRSRVMLSSAVAISAGVASRSVLAVPRVADSGRASRRTPGSAPTTSVSLATCSATTGLADCSARPAS